MDTTRLQQQLQAIDPMVWLGVAGVVVVVAMALTIFLVHRSRRRRSLRRRYGAEYDHTARHAGSRRGADRELLEREAERRRYAVRELDAGERDRLRARWEALQASFVDDPATAVRAADETVAEVAGTRGYPTEGRDPLAMVSIDHPRAVDRYRAAGWVVEQNPSAAATEDLRHAMLAARDLFETLVGTTGPAGAGPRSAFRALLEEDEEPDPVAQGSSMPLYGSDGRPVWGEHAGRGPAGRR